MSENFHMLIRQILTQFGKGGSRILKLGGGGGGINFCNNVREIKYYFNI